MTEMTRITPQGTLSLTLDYSTEYATVYLHTGHADPEAFECVATVYRRRRNETGPVWTITRNNNDKGGLWPDNRAQFGCFLRVPETAARTILRKIADVLAVEARQEAEAQDAAKYVVWYDDGHGARYLNCTQDDDAIDAPEGAERFDLEGAKAHVQRLLQSRQFAGYNLAPQPVKAAQAEPVRAFLVYQGGIANVFKVDCLNMAPYGRNARRLLQSDFKTCAAFARGMAAAGASVATAFCNMAGDITDATWSDDIEQSPFRDSLHHVIVSTALGMGV